MRINSRDVRNPLRATSRWLARGAWLTVLLVCTAGAVNAQFLPPPAPEMSALAWLEGEWSGTGWIVEGGQRATFHGTEWIERRMGDRLVVVEGRFLADIGPGGEAVVHEALGVFSWDPSTSKYTFRAYTAYGGNGEAAEADVSDGRVVWSYDDPQMGRVRYTITRTDDDRWHEVGHASTDGGETWQHFFEMTLTRQ